ncbi:MAG: MFS transporter [Deltaproteobacteria bacterium]|nr:MFS transporter [Deltaproteobacteria bacterium]
MDSNKSYKWYILVLIGLTATLVMAMPGMAIPVLFAEISDDLDLSLVQIGAVWGAGSLAGMFTALLGGILGDRFGTRRTLAIGCLAIGLIGATRGFSNNFPALAGTMLLTGFIGSVIPLNLHKACGVWFSGKRLGLANGVVSAGMALGFMSGSMVSASVLSPWLGGWRQVLWFYGAVAVIISIPWALSKSAPGDLSLAKQSAGTVSIRKSIAHVARIRNVWLLGGALLGIGGCIQGFLGYLPLYLREIGWSPVQADTALASFHAVSLAAVFPIAYFSDRLDTRRWFLIAASLMTSIGVGTLAFASGSAIWLAVVFAGIVRDGFMAIFMTLVIEQKGVGPKHAGIAIGLTLTLSQLGGLLAPPLGNSLGIFNLRFPFILWAVMALFGLVCLTILTEEKP